MGDDVCTVIGAMVAEAAVTVAAKLPWEPLYRCVEGVLAMEAKEDVDRKMAGDQDTNNENGVDLNGTLPYDASEYVRAFWVRGGDECFSTRLASRFCLDS
jgi:hypothetical protein